jgi:trk system potassium uptake protein TrkA
MKVIICGAGQVGWQIARHLSSEKNDVTVVDNNAELVARATDTLDVGGVTGFASYPDVLARAGANDYGNLPSRPFGFHNTAQDCKAACTILFGCYLL